MGNPESGIRIPEPRDEFRKARLGKMGNGMSQDIGFTNFQLAQKLDANGKKLGRASYGVNLQGKTGNEKQDELLIYLTQYISDIELGPVEVDDTGRFVFDKDANATKRDKILEGIINPCIVFFGKVEDKFKEFKDIQYFSIEKGVLSLGIKTPPREDIQILDINISSVFTRNTRGEFVFNEKKMDQELQGKVKEDLSKLRESLETESFFDGAIVVSYEKKEIAKQTLGVGLQTIGTLGAVSTLEYSVRRMMFRDEAGRMQDVDPKIVRTILKGIGDKTRINTLIMKVMQGTGRVYNGIRNSFTDVMTLGIDRATEKVRAMKRSDIENGRTMTDAQFEIEKNRVISEIARTPKSTLLMKSGELIKGIPGKTMHYMFWGVFFAEYQKNSHDITNAYKGIAETVLFFSGANLGSRVAPGAWKMPAGLIGGGLAILGGHSAGGALGLDKKMWRMMPDRIAGDDAKSVTGHILSGGATNDGIDKMSTDIGIPGTRGGAMVYNPLGKDGIIPNIDFARTHIDFGVNPREYLQSRIGGTDIHWNKRVDEYVKWSTDAVMRVLWEYENSKGYFSPKNGDKNMLLKERLRNIFDSEDGKNKRNSMIVEDCIEYISTRITKISDLSLRKERLNIFLANYGNILKIDEASIKYDEILLERDKAILSSQTRMYLENLSPEKRVFAEKVFMRLQKGERLVDGRMIEAINSRGGKNKLWQSDRKEMDVYTSLLDDSETVKQEWYDILGYTEVSLEDSQKKLGILDQKYGLGVSGNIGKDMVEVSEGLWRILRLGILEGCGKTDQNFGKKYEQLIKTLRQNPSFPFQIPANQMVSLPTGVFALKDVMKDYSAVSANLYKKNPPPTIGDAFYYLLTTHSEYREQKKYIETQKSIGYANKWKLF